MKAFFIIGLWLGRILVVVDSKREIEVEWYLCKASESALDVFPEEGRLLSEKGPLDFGNGCFSAVVPGTVFANLIHNGTYGANFDPYFEDNLALVPDINATGTEPWLFYYVAAFTTPNETDVQTLLHLRSINYEANLWLNGQAVVPNSFPGTPDPLSVKGMFQRFFFPLGRLKPSSRYFVTILVHPPPNPGSCNGEQGGSHDLAKDGAISQYTAGWDWIQGTPDRNTGLWDKASITSTGDVQLRDATVRVRNINVQKKSAVLHFSASLYNRNLSASLCTIVASRVQLNRNGENDSDETQKNLTQGDETVSVILKPGESNASTDFEPLPVQNIKLWHPHTHGSPYLYNVHMVVGSTPCIGQSSDQDTLLNETFSQLKLQTMQRFDDINAIYDDEEKFNFGIRKIEPILNSTLGGLQFYINEKPVFLVGGNWIASDQLMRFIGNSDRAEAEVRLHRAMGFNIIRVWGGGIAERPEFYDACDRLGILVLQDFWMSGDNNGRWAGSYDWPLNHSLYLAAVRDTILIHRNHPSLLLYDAGNELYPTTKSPPPRLLADIRQTLKNLSPDTFFLVSTMTNSSKFVPELSLAPLDGPYAIMATELFYERNPGLWDWHNHSAIRFDYPNALMPFQPEIGSVSHPTYQSMLNFLSEKNTESFPERGDSKVPHLWEYHKFIGFTPANTTPAGTAVAPHLVVDHVYQYGTPSNTSEYCIRAQLAQYVQYRALFESYQAKMWEWYTAAIFWKSQGPWPALRGALYDWYLAPTGGYYGARSALLGGKGDLTPRGPSPAATRVHAQMNQKHHNLTLIIGPQAIDSFAKPNTDINIVITVNAYDLEGCTSGTKRLSINFSLKPREGNVFLNIPDSTLPWSGHENGSSVLLYRIEAFVVNDAVISSIVKRSSIADYWFSDWTDPKSEQDFRTLGAWRNDLAQRITLKASAERCHGGGSLDRCNEFGCDTDSLLVEIRNEEECKKLDDKKKNCCASGIAFGVSAELHYNTRVSKTKYKDTRVLPSEYSDGIISVLSHEARHICITPGPGTETILQDLEVRLFGWNVHNLVLQVPTGDNFERSQHYTNAK